MLRIVEREPKDPSTTSSSDAAEGRATGNGANGSSFIERLAFGDSTAYNAIEAAIHLNRYLVVRRICGGRRVLDLACGEGYGSFLIAQHWGASSVAGVDISEAAISSARKLFASPNIEYYQEAAEKVGTLFEASSFDLVVSLETIEHVADPVAVLTNIKRLLKPHGVAAISCPNDHWYYRRPGERNPFHQRQYTFSEFLELTENILGPAAMLMLGTPVAGFMNVPVGRAGTTPGEREPKAILTARDCSVSLLPSHEEIRCDESSYFIACWGPAEDLTALEQAAIFPLTMTSSGPAAQAQSVSNLREELTSLTAQRDQAKAERDQARAEGDQARAELDEAKRLGERETRRLGLRVEAIHAENDHLRQELSVANEDFLRLTERLTHLEPSVIPLKDYLRFSRDFVWGKIPGFPTRVRNLARGAARRAVNRLLTKL